MSLFNRKPAAVPAPSPVRDADGHIHGVKGGDLRPFHLVRETTTQGVVAEGVKFSDGTVVLRWLGEHQSTVVWPDLDTAMAVHGHEGATSIVWATR